MVMVFRMHWFAFISMVLGRRIRTDTDEMQLQADDSKPFPWVGKLKDQAAKHAPKHTKSLQQKATQGWNKLADTAKFAIEADKAKSRVGEEVHAAMAQSRQRIAQVIASEANRVKFDVEEQVRTGKAELAKAADKANAESANEANKPEKEELQTARAAKFAKEINKVKNTTKEGSRTSEAEWAKARGKAEAELATKTNKMNSSMGEKSQTSLVVNFAHDFKIMSSSVREWVEERGRVIARLAYEANQIRERIKGSLQQSSEGGRENERIKEQSPTAREGVTSTIKFAMPGIKTAVEDPDDEIWESVGKKNSSREEVASTIKSAMPGVKTAVEDPDDEIWKSIGKKNS